MLKFRLLTNCSEGSTIENALNHTDIAKYKQLW